MPSDGQVFGPPGGVPHWAGWVGEGPPPGVPGHQVLKEACPRMDVVPGALFPRADAQPTSCFLAAASFHVALQDRHHITRCSNKEFLPVLSPMEQYWGGCTFFVFQHLSRIFVRCAFSKKAHLLHIFFLIFEQFFDFFEPIFLVNFL